MTLTLSDFLQLLAEIAQTDKEDGYAAVVGLAIKADGSGRTTDATDVSRTKDCPHGADLTEWSTPKEGAVKLERELRYKLRMLRRDNEAAKEK